MNLETLQYFLYIAKYKNITKAAKHFYISQSTLSRNIMALEEELKARLFERHHKQLELTEAGKVFEQECALLMKHMEIILHNVQVADQGNTGVLRITSPGNLCQTLSDSLTLFHQEHPSIELIVETYDFNEIPSAVQYNLYQIGFTYDFAAAGYDDLERISIGADDFAIVVSSSLFPKPTPKSISGIVESLPLILPSHIEPPFMKLMIHELQSYSGIRKITPTYVNNTDSAMLKASLGLGYSIVPISLTKSTSGEGGIAYIPLEDFSAKSTIVMLYKKEFASELVLSYVDTVKSLCAESSCTFQ
ncbi:LysR family transcriptional regulator [Anoxynatronum buryatiense]|uniref:DNA-binding transcriptional regulator, LysR family n=1 Tax=Anoxynatronum buryatiense TaxID=489973 RepID=A0AA46AHU9_9CLOT|nr:LysR family transcriptional regulator [Anoxynatronum buryatiense]SMP42826.1 DNA-binding transcriptional regulator, LysR family [Anoxynatronum buryatiense]